METETREIKRYLLGSLTPPEMEAIDLQIIADENTEESLVCAESELMEDYLDQMLSPPEVALFEQNFLTFIKTRQVHQAGNVPLEVKIARVLLIHFFVQHGCFFQLAVLEIIIG